MKKTITIIYFLAIGNFLFAQESVNTSGGKGEGSGGTVSFSVGQTVYTTDSSSAGTVAKGVQQAYIISNVNSIKKADKITLNSRVFPNPTTDLLYLSMEKLIAKDMQYTLTDANGKTLFIGKISELQTEIDMKPYAAAVYFLKINDQNQIIKTFKIIKN
jgi:hypothetical protein